MLPFDLFSAMGGLKLQEKVEFHMNRTSVSQQELGDWKFEKYMVKFRDAFESLCKEKWYGIVCYFTGNEMRSDGLLYFL